MGDDRDESSHDGGTHDSMKEGSTQDSPPVEPSAPADDSGLADPNETEVVDDASKSAECEDEAQLFLPSSGPLPAGDGDNASSCSATANAADMEALKAENKSLRSALEEAQEELKLTHSRGGGLGVRPSGREPGNGGVAYSRMRRLLLKDRRFLRETFLPFLNVEDLGR